jgi:hypothetical protein
MSTTVTVTETNTGVTVTSPGPQGPVGGGITGYCGSFFSSADQANAGANQVNNMTFNNTDFANGVSIVSNSQITIASAGKYNIQFSAQFTKTDSGDDSLDIWLAKNNSNIAWSNTTLQVLGNNGKIVAAWNWLVDAAAGDYYQIRWSSADAEVSLFKLENLTTPTRPNVPSVILTVNQVG